MPSLESNPRNGRIGRGLVLLLVGVTVVAAIVLAFITQQLPPAPPPPAEAPENEDPRWTFETPFLNVRPDVRYVGDAACVDCHGAIAGTYHQHPMGRSIVPLAAMADNSAAATGAFDVGNLHYVSKTEGGRLIHRSRAVRPDGSPFAERDAEIDYVIGSGGRGHSYLFAEDGYLFQSPMSWYASRRAVDLSPGYRDRNAHFDRPVDANCLFCHANHAEPVEQTINRYRDPIFNGHAIGCERCHGPGELHVRQPGAAKGIDYTIVNPRHLEPALREAVCRQCHLQGQARVVRAGRGVFDYRPGLPLELFIDTFVWHPGVPHGQKAVGHVEQMLESACFTKSAGKLGCATCHDPHEKPSPVKAADYFRGRCLTCHAEAQCEVPIATRREKNGDACAACHMPRAAAADVVHVSVTDHRILRAPDKARTHRPAPPRPGEPPLVPFHAGSPYVNREDAERNLALALAHLAGQTAPGAQRDYLLHLALPRLGKLPRLASDPPAQLAFGTTLRSTGRAAEALTELESLLQRQPRHEQALVAAASAAREVDRPGVAASFWRRAIEVSPRRWNYHFQLADALAVERDWSGALAASAEARKLNPVNPDARWLEVRCLIELGRREDAKSAFADLLALSPPRAEELKAWFQKQLER